MSEIKSIKEPLQPHEVEWRVQSAKNGHTIVVPYIQNRAVMNRLDEVHGEMYWKNHYRRWSDKGILCGISIYDRQGGTWVTKWDGADETNIEPTKGGLSDSMKRAAVQWGMGRDLYEYPTIRLEGESKYVPFWAKSKLEKVVQAFLDGKLDKDIYTLKNS